jgi:lysine 2,3-aminomutase
MVERIKSVYKNINNETFEEEHMKKWRNWKWQMKKSIKDVDTVEKILGIKFNIKEREKINYTINQFPMAITPYYISLIDKRDYANDPVFRQCFPDVKEIMCQKHDMKDPLYEDKNSPVPGITHRYPDRVLFHVSNLCAMYCRHCTRKRKVGDIDGIPSKQELLKGIEYIKNTPAVRDVLISGGDPFLLSDELIKWILDKLSSIKHVEVIRIGTRTPVVLPYRITDELIEILGQYDNLWLNTHFNHPREITGDSKQALKKLSGVGIPLGNQTVLLNGINDCSRIIKKLCHLLVKNRVRPYYLYQCDLSEGLEHFRTSVGKGIEIMENLQGHTSGFAVPTYVIDAPGGGGKIPVMPNYLVSWSTDKVVLRNYEGVITTYTMPEGYTSLHCEIECENCKLQFSQDKNENMDSMIGISKLLCDHENAITINPENLERFNRKSEETA